MAACLHTCRPGPKAKRRRERGDRSREGRDAYRGGHDVSASGFAPSGHLAGDQCLRRVAHTIDRALKRPADFSARYGGEEFVCLLANTDAEGAKEVAQAILTAVRKKEIPHGGSRAGDVVTVSIGGATWEPGDAGMLGDLVAAADAALYEAKAEGRNRVCYWVRDAAAGNRTSDDRRLV